jgi:replicative DNA helicase
MLNTISRVEAYAQSRDARGGIQTGFHLFDAFTDGLQSGLILFGGQANSGKTALMMQMCWQSSLDPTNNVYNIYFSLDDPATDTLPRIIACDQRLPINTVKFPKRITNTRELGKRNLGLRRLRGNISHFKIYDQLDGTSIEFIADTIQRHKVELEAAGDDRQLCIWIDGFHEIDCDGFQEENARQSYLARALDNLSQQYECPVICSAEFKKFENPNRRPTLGDFKGAVKLVYKSKLCCLCYNEVGVKKETAKCFHVRDGIIGKQPILEVDFAKNKLSSFKGNLYYKFFPEMSHLEEIPMSAIGEFKN